MSKLFGERRWGAAVSDAPVRGSVGARTPGGEHRRTYLLITLLHETGTVTVTVTVIVTVIVSVIVTVIVTTIGIV